MTTHSAAVWSVVLVRCKYCNKPHDSIELPVGVSIRVTFRCSDRGCRVEQQFTT